MTEGVAGGNSPVTHLPPVPPSLAARGVELRLETPEDYDFLRQLYIEGRWEEMAPTGWPPSAITAFLGQQFDFQTKHYRLHYDGAAWGIVILDGRPVGRLYLHRESEDLRIVDISILTGYRNQGIGSALIRSVFDLATQENLTVSIHVESFNTNARRLYDRLGFVPGKSVGVYSRMDWAPPVASA